MLDLKKTLTKLMAWMKLLNDRLTFEAITTVSYTTSTTWAKAGTFTVNKQGIYRIRAAYQNAPVGGVAIGGANITGVSLADTIYTSDTNGSLDFICFLSAKQYSLWVKCSSAGKTNNVQISRLINV